MAITPVKPITTTVFTFGYFAGFTTGGNPQEGSKSRSL